MSALKMLLPGVTVLGIGALVYSVTVATVAVVSVLSRTHARRRDARETLTILLRGRRQNRPLDGG